MLLPSLAQADNQTEADRLFDEGRRLREQKKVDEACERFEQAYALDQGPGIGGNLAWCYDERGELRRAWHLYLSSARQWERTGRGDKAEAARRAAALVASRATTVVLRVANPGLEDLKISINDEDFAPASEIRELVEPGKIRISATAAGHRTFERRKKAARGETVELDIALTRDGVAPPRDPRRGRVRGAIGLFVGAGVTGATGLTLALVGSSVYNSAFKLMGCTRDECTNQAGRDRIERGQTYANVATGFAIASGVLAVTSAIVYLTAPRARVVPIAAAAHDASLVGVALRF